MKPFWRQAMILALLAVLILSGGRAAQSQQSTQDATAAAPRVIASSPAQREVVTPGTAIQLTFDQPMDRASVESALTIAPKVNGKASWTDDSTLIFTPNAPLQRGQEYTLSVGTDAKAKAGAALEEAYKLTFQVNSNLAVQPVVPAPEAQRIEAGAAITVVFTQPVVPLINSADQARLPQPLTFSPAVESKGERVGTG